MRRHVLCLLLVLAVFVCVSLGQTTTSQNDRSLTTPVSISPDIASSSVPVLFPVRHNKKFGYIDAAGKLVIPYRFASAEVFSDGLGLVRDRNGYGYIDATGKYVIAPQFPMAQAFSEQRAAVMTPKGLVLIDTTGRHVAELKYMPTGPFQQGRATVLRHEDIGFIDRDGNILAEPQYEGGAGPFAKGLAPAHLEGDDDKGHPDPAHEWGYIDEHFKVVLPAQFRHAGAFSDGLAPVQVDQKWGYIDHSGKLVIPPQFLAASPFSEGLARIAQSDRRGYVHYGFIDRSGTVVIQPQFNLADHFSSGLAAVKVGKSWGYIDKQGHFVVKPQFYFANRYQHGVGHVLKRRADKNIVDLYFSTSGEPINGAPRPLIATAHK